ncbi:conserved hypothetical protein [Leishmania major strain Friedlin]|uniref:Uncharacterized protein n=1 Tax=Leishmania major TaxID=5664 RepID=E9ADN6_LEIMA|nr:conserved hypothetical protein [Leishmania major strain Friedlin]CAG9577763.1 hypothetical_protein_-_conserved [Leishmania major strain Friedlin]CBZ12365.1 conserved hypothetical protein [Leishmania major strain Friedlin]|eukprot:XP_003722108.1 conserved hypothetical protein [Leishmania major strain Friedlin]
MASAEDGINRNRLRQEAGRRVQHITCGVAERQTYRDVLLHIEDRFAHASHEELRPLVLPPQLPSIVRPRDPQMSKFSRGMTMRHRLKGGSSAGAFLSAAALTGGPRHGGTDGHREPAEATTEASTEAASASTGFTDAHRWEMLDVTDRAFFRRLTANAPTSTCGSTASSTVAAPSEPRNLAASTPMDLLSTLAEKCAYLCELETAERQYVLAYERWDQQVVLEMMAVNFVTFVLKPCMDVLRKEELEQREAIAQEEDRLSFYMYNDSSLALQVQEGKKALKARMLQLDRILGLTSAAPRSTALVEAPAEATHATSVTAAPASAAVPVQSEGVSKGSPMSFSLDARTASLVAVTSPQLPLDTGVPSDEARRILRRYVLQRHGASLSAVGACTAMAQYDNNWPQTMASAYPSGDRSDTVCQSSTLILPPIASAQAPRRNAVGIADYIALLDESTKYYEQIVKTEERCRTDMNQAFYEELQVVLEWQRHRMHLERLLYWRRQRETVLQEEVEALITVTPVLRLDAKVLLLLEILEGEEETARRSVQDEEHAFFQLLRQAGEDLRDVNNNVSLQERCMDTLSSKVWAAEAVARRRLVIAEEADVRRYSERLYREHLTATLTGGMAQLRALWHVSTVSAQCAALQVLQKAFRRSLCGRLGWRFTHQALGCEINDARNAKKIATGKLAFQSFKNTLLAERAQLCEEQAQQHLREQYKLFTNESGDRAAVCAEQEWSRNGVARARLLHVEEVYAPLLTGTVVAESEARLELEVEEELDRDALLVTNTALIRIIEQKEATLLQERAGRKSTVREEETSWRQLLSVEYDEREVHRIDEEARAATRETARAAFAEAAVDESCRHHERAMLMHVARMSEALVRLLSYEVGDSARRRGIEQEEAVAARNLLDTMATTQCAAYASTLEQCRQVELDRVHQQAICIEEMENRASILHEEAAAWVTTEQEALILLSGPLHDLLARRGAVNVISTWYTALRNGEIGRSVSRQRLRQDLSRHREERQLRSQQIAQRLHTQHVRSQLDTLMMEMQKDQQEAMQQLLNTLVKFEEPRKREQIASLQEIVFGILERNAEAHLVEVRRNFVNTEALIWQQESYERKVLTKAWRRTREELLEQRRLQLNEDYFALRIQRTWRKYAAELECRRKMSVQLAQLAALEVQARAAVGLEELEEAATQLHKLCLSSLYVDTHVRQSLMRACDELAVVVADATQAEEWSERVSLLWEMCYEDCDPCLCEDEARARRVLEAQFHKPFLLQSELKDEEHLQRTMLMRERTLFLLRILAREEHQRRLSLMSVEDQQRVSLHEQLTASTPVDVQVQ